MGVYKPAFQSLALCLISRQGFLPLPLLSLACCAGNSPRFGSDAFLPRLPFLSCRALMSSTKLLSAALTKIDSSKAFGGS
ncbi:mCG147258 [Mus musculus]|nr:mCG147258 [Mus musculus]